MTERMAVELTVYLDVPNDATEAQMDECAETVRQTVEAATGHAACLLSAPFLVDYPHPGGAA